MIASLTDRHAMTNQRLWTDLSADGKWFISGGTDGYVRTWKTEGSRELLPSIEIKAHNGKELEIEVIVDSVTAAVLHPSWSMMATTSGSHHFDMEEGGSESKDYSMKVWVFD